MLTLTCANIQIDEKQDEILVKCKKKTRDDSELKKWQIARLKYKCSITLLSLLEARKDYNNVYRMMKSLPMEVLKRNITDIYLLFETIYKGVYTNKAFLHVRIENFY